MEILITLAINGFTGFLKNKVKPKYGAMGVHFIVFGLALIASGIVAVVQANPNFMDFAVKAMGYLVSSVAMYELILKKASIEAPKK
jgi:hypothetical protein